MNAAEILQNSARALAAQALINDPELIHESFDCPAEKMAELGAPARHVQVIIVYCEDPAIDRIYDVPVMAGVRAYDV